MGEYWKPVNVTRKEFIHPHRLGNGLKLLEWNHPDTRVRKLMAERWPETDDVRAVSDYGGDMQLSGVRGPEKVTYEDLYNDGDSSAEEDSELGPCRYRMISEEPVKRVTYEEAVVRLLVAIDELPRSNVAPHLTDGDLSEVDEAARLVKELTP